MRIASDGHVTADGRAAWAWVCSDGTQDAGLLPRGSASHLAEWRGVEEALRHLASHGPGDVVLQTDAALVAKGLAASKPAMSGEAARLRAACRQALAALAGRGVKVQVERVPREANAAADALARATAQGAPEGPSPAGR